MSNRATKSEMLRFLATPSEAKLLRRAATEQRTSLSEFVREKSIVAAVRILDEPSERSEDEP